MTNDADNCLKLHMTWKRRYKDETNADLKKQVKDEVSKLKTDFKAYKMDMATKKKTLQPSGPPPPTVSMPATSSGGQDLLLHLRQEQRREMATKKIQVQGGLEQFLTEFRVMDWEDAEDVQIQQAMNKVDRWEGIKLKAGENV